MLCSGDIRTVLELCREIYKEAIVENKLIENTNIDFKLQDRIIKSFSRNHLGMVKEIPAYGDKLFIIANTFGQICKKYLYEYGPITQEENRYYEMIRIEIEGYKKLRDEAQELYENLLKFSIFIDAGEGYPRREVLTTRLFFRRIFAPAFQMSYRERECLRLSPERFEEFLLNPIEFKKFGTDFLKDLTRRDYQVKLPGID